jgi:hypothetical protein
MEDRLIPEGGTNPYVNHPGWTADSCGLRITVTGNNNGSISGGFACSMSGGHCLPEKDLCANRIKREQERMLFESMLRDY